MSVLSDRAINQAIQKKAIIIDPLLPNNIQPSSIDLTLYREIEIFENEDPIDITKIRKEEIKTRTRLLNIENGYILKPGHFVTGYSHEYIEISTSFCGIICNRNSLSKIGINAAISSYMNPGFRGRKVIVIANNGMADIILYPNIRICQLVLFQLDSETIRDFDNRHDLNANNFFNQFKNSIKEYNVKLDTVDNPLADFLNKRIAEMAKRH